MTTIQIKLKDVYVDRLLAIISNHQEIEIDDIAVDSLPPKTRNIDKLLRKQRLLQIAEECANLPTLNDNSPEQLLGYEESKFGL